MWQLYGTEKDPNTLLFYCCNATPTSHHSPLSLCEAAAAEPMEMRPSTAGGDDSPHGLMFGKKIYFEDGVGGAGGGGGGSSSSKAPPAPAVRKGRGVLQGGGGQQQQQQPPRCQVEGCDADLSGVKAYYCRHKVCGMHSKAPKVVVGGMEQRFCQQCSRFHQLTEFDQGKRSCRRRLAGHNERRRKPPLGPFASRYEPSRFRSFLMDFGRPKISGAARDIWPAVGCGDMVPSNQWHGMVHAPPNAAAAVVAVHRANPYFQGSPGQIYSSPELPPGKCIAGATDASCALSLLSTQPRGNTTTTAAAARSQAPAITENTSFGATQMAHPFMFPSNYMANSWGAFRNPESRNSSSRQTQHETGTSGVNEAGGAHFSGELELALQGNGQCPGHGMGREYDHSGHVSHWSL